MTQFAIFATLLIVVVAAFILPPLWLGRRAPGARAGRQQANLAIFRDQLTELERERREGALADGDFEQARRELQRRLLEEVEPAADAPPPDAHRPSRKTAIAILVLLPIVAVVAYGMLGKPQALDPRQTAAQPKMTPEQIDAMVAKLAERMQANPDDLQGWLMLARSYKTLNRYEEAAAAYGKAEKVINDDPELLASYAETIAMASGQGLTSKAAQLIERALKLDPQQPHALFLAGAAAMEAGDTEKAIAYWEAMLPLVEPGSEIDRMLRGGIDKMKQGG